jgi:2-polyprenyl-3-methyl-5-hydroxy-6-metoxy-1,4-benzoquinol methylase
MIANINTTVLNEITSHHRNLGMKFRLKGLGYERCAELSWVIDQLKPRFPEPLQYLDIGTGESPLPSFLAAHSRWEITCLDKCHWVQRQHRFSKKIESAGSQAGKFRVIEANLLEANLPSQSFDIITSISVIEHFEGSSDSAAMKETALLLRPGGRLILTTLVNEPFFAEFYLNRSVYGSAFRGSPVFYQRHYDVKSLEERLIRPSGLVEKQRVYFGDYGFQCFEKLQRNPKPLRMFYAWNMPSLAKRYLSYREYPVSRKDMRMNTSSGLILVLEKPSGTASSSG